MRTITRLSPSVLVAAKSRSLAGYIAIASVVAALIFYAFAWPRLYAYERVWGILIGVVVVLIVIPTVWVNARIARKGDVFVFDREKRVVTHNERPVATFAGVERVHMRTHSYGGDEWYRLMLNLKDGGRIHLDAGYSKRKTTAGGAEIAAFVGVTFYNEVTSPEELARRRRLPIFLAILIGGLLLLLLILRAFGVR